MIMMKKLLMAFALLGIVLVSGCTGESQPIGTNDNASNSVNIQVNLHEGACRQNTDCLLTHCELGTTYDCVNTIQTETIIKCNDLGKMVTEKNYDLCGCIDSVCKGK